MQLLKRLTPFIVIVVIVVIYFGVPLAHDRYQNRSNSTISTIFGDDSTGDTIDEATGSLHDFSVLDEGYQESIQSELPKLTKQTRVLLDQYNSEEDPKLLFNLVESLTDDGAYFTAIYLYQILLNEYPDEASYTQYLKLLLNRGEYLTGFLEQYQNSINSLVASGSISKDDARFFTSFRSLIGGDIDTFYQSVSQLSGDYAPIVTDLINNLNTYSQYKQAPKQYLRGLFASTLLRHGYYSPAIHLAQQSLQFNPDYVLGLQVTAYSNLIIHNWDVAKEYLTKLMTLDSSHLLTYQRLYGIASYWDSEHKDAVRYLSQVHQKIPSIELLRYLGLSYRSLYDYTHVARTYREILETQQMTDIDYFEFFDAYRRSIAYYTGMDFSENISPIAQNDATLLQNYITSCNTIVASGQTYICLYGEALQTMFAGDTASSLEKMITIAPSHPYDFVYAMIGDLYLIQDQIPTAQIYYQRAIESSYNGGYQRYLANKITQLPSDGS